MVLGNRLNPYKKLLSAFAKSCIGCFFTITYYFPKIPNVF